MYIAAHISVNQVALATVQLDQGALLAKTDIRAAYRLVRVWLAMKWQGAIMLMPCSHLASGLFLSCPMQWLMYWNGASTNGVSIWSATTCGNRPPGSSLCEECLLVLSNKNVNTWVSCWQLRKEKVLAQWSYYWHSAGAASSYRGQAAVPCAVSVWVAHMQHLHPQRAQTTHWDPTALLQVIRPGRSLLHWVISLLSIAKWPHHHIRFNHGSMWPDVVKGVL